MTAPVTQPPEPTWMDPYLAYLRYGILTDNKNEARKIQTKAAHYVLIDGELYRKSYGGPHLKYLTSKEAEMILEEIHEGDCGNHSVGGTMALTERNSTSVTLWFFLPYMQADAQRYVRKCDKCQRHAKLIHAPAEELNLCPILGPLLNGGWTSWDHSRMRQEIESSFS